MGHFFNLRHISGDDGNLCTGTNFPGTSGLDDTPNQTNATLGNPDASGIGQIKTDDCSPSFPGIMYQIFLDYTDDIAMAMFTLGQHTRMESAITVSPDRFPLLSSNKHRPTIVRNLDARIRQIVSPLDFSNQCNTSLHSKIILRNSGATNLTSVQIVSILNSATPLVYNWTGNLSPYSEINVELPAMTSVNGLNNLQIFTQAPNGSR